MSVYARDDAVNRSRSNAYRLQRTELIGARYGRILRSRHADNRRRTLKQLIDARVGQNDQFALTGALDARFSELNKAEWNGFPGVKRSYAAASIVSADRVVLNIKEGSYRLLVTIGHEKAIDSIKWIGIHTTHDRIDVRAAKHDN